MKLGLGKGETVTYKKEVLESMLSDKLTLAKKALYYDLSRSKEHSFMVLFLEIHNISKIYLLCMSNVFTFCSIQNVDIFWSLAYYLFVQNQRKIRIERNDDSDYIITGI
jgi:hypothetical protein